MKTDLNRKIIRFIGISYAFTWLAWLPGILASAGIIPAIPWSPFFALGTCGPIVAATWCLHREGGWHKVKNWLRQGFTRQISWGWWVFILLTPFIIPALASLI